jgi:hypothetical protein
VCGALVSSPQLMLGGIVPKDTRAVPALGAPSATYDATCAQVAAFAAASGSPYTLACGGATVTATRK